MTLPLPPLPKASMMNSCPPLPKLPPLPTNTPRVIAANDFQSHREFPFWLKATKMISREDFPNAAAHLAESLRLMDTLIAAQRMPPPLPLPLPPLPGLPK